MDHDLTRYINDHLAGSSGALVLIDELAGKHPDPEACEFLRGLKGKIEEERGLLDGLLEKIDKNPSLLMKTAGKVAARVGGLKLMWEKIEPGELGMFEALEMLVLGIQGKRVLWCALAEIQPWFPEWKDMDFAALEMNAISQRDQMEELRLEAARESLVSPERRALKAG